MCRIYKKTQMIKNLSLTAFQEVYKISPHSETHKINVFLRESGDFLSLFISLLLTVVDVATLT